MHGAGVRFAAFKFGCKQSLVVALVGGQTIESDTRRLVAILFLDELRLQGMLDVVFIVSGVAIKWSRDSVVFIGSEGAPRWLIIALVVVGERRLALEGSSGGLPGADLAIPLRFTHLPLPVVSYGQSNAFIASS